MTADAFRRVATAMFLSEGRYRPIDLATIDLDALHNLNETHHYNDAVVTGLYLETRGEYHGHSTWQFEFHRGIIDIYRHGIGPYPETALDEARRRALAKLAMIEAETMPVEPVECAAYDLALTALKAGDLNRRDEVIRGLLRIARVPTEMRSDINIDLQDLPPSEALQKPILELSDDKPLSARTHNCLRNSDITIVAHALLVSDAELMRKPNFGRKSLKELRGQVNAFIAQWKTEAPPPAISQAVVLQHRIIDGMNQQITVMQDILSIMETLAKEDQP